MFGLYYSESEDALYEITPRDGGRLGFVIVSDEYIVEHIELEQVSYYEELTYIGEI